MCVGSILQADVGFEYARTDDDSKALNKHSFGAALQQERRPNRIGIEAFHRECKDKDSSRHVIKRNPENFNDALNQLKTSIANQMAIYESKSANYNHRQIYFADGTVSPTDKGNMSRPLDNEGHNLAQIVTKLADIMLSTNQHSRGLTD